MKNTSFFVQKYKKDVKMLVQGFLCNVTLICIEIMYYMPHFSDNHLAIYLFIYASLPGATPLFSLAMDQTLRRCLVTGLSRKTTSAQVGPAPPTLTATPAGTGQKGSLESQKKRESKKKNKQDVRRVNTMPAQMNDTKF